MTIIEGKKAGFWCPQLEANATTLTSTAATGEAMTQVGATMEYYIDTRSKCWWDPNKAVVVYDGVTTITPSRIDYAGGYVTLQSTPTGAVTADIYYFALEALGGAYGWKADLKADTKEVTTFPAALNTATAWKEYVSTLEGWNCSISRHFFTSKASVTTAIATANANLKWEWRAGGKAGNDEAIVYEAGAELQIARADNVTTVTYVAATSTAANVKAHLEADPVLAALWDVSYPVDNDGSGVVGAVSHVHAAGGRDSSDLARLGTKVLAVMYLNNTTGAIGKLEGVGNMTGLGPDCKLEALVESDVTIEGTGALRYHTV